MSTNQRELCYQLAYEDPLCHCRNVLVLGAGQDVRDYCAYDGYDEQERVRLVLVVRANDVEHAHDASEPWDGRDYYPERARLGIAGLAHELHDVTWRLPCLRGPGGGPAHMRRRCRSSCSWRQGSRARSSASCRRLLSLYSSCLSRP